MQGGVLENLHGKHTMYIKSLYFDIKNTDLSPLRVLDASESQVTDAPAGVDAVYLQLGELK